MVNYLYNRDVWDTDVGRFGIDVWLTTMALVKGFRICQAHLGAKIHDAKDPGQSLGPMFRQVVATMFSLMEENREYWWEVRGSEPIPVSGEEIDIEPEEFPISIRTLIESFRNGYYQFGTLWQEILSEASFREVRKLAEGGDGFEMEDRMWSHILFDAASMYHCWQRNRFKLVELLTPLYYARVASNARTVEKMSDAEAEEDVERQAGIFEDEKPYLLERWEKADERIRNGSCGQTPV